MPRAGTRINAGHIFASSNDFERDHRLVAGPRHHVEMSERTDLITASRVDLAVLLLPAITWLEASCMLAVSGVPAEVAARVLALPGARRAPAAR